MTFRSFEFDWTFFWSFGSSQLRGQDPTPPGKVLHLRVIKLRLRFVTVNLRACLGEGCHLMNHKGGMRHLMVHQDFDKNTSHPIRGIHIKLKNVFWEFYQRLVSLDTGFVLGMLLGWTYSSTLWGVAPKHLTFFSTRNRWKSMSHNGKVHRCLCTVWSRKTWVNWASFFLQEIGHWKVQKKTRVF